MSPNSPDAEPDRGDTKKIINYHTIGYAPLECGYLEYSPYYHSWGVLWSIILEWAGGMGRTTSSEMIEMLERASLSDLKTLLFTRLSQIEKEKNTLALLEIFYLEIILQFLDLHLPPSNDTFSQAANLPYQYYSVSDSTTVLVHQRLFEYLTTNEKAFLEYLKGYVPKFRSAREEQIKDFVSLMARKYLGDARNFF